MLPIRLACALLCGTAALVAADANPIHAEALKHFQSVVRIDSTNPPGNESKVVEYLKSVLDREGIPSQVFTLDAGRGNLVARLKGNGSKRPVLILGHTDTVGIQREKWPVDPFGALLQNGFIWGRGTTDNKDMVTAGLMLLLQLKRLKVPLDRDVIYVAEAGEESTSRVGIDFLVGQHWADIEAEYALAEGGFVHASNGKVTYLEVATTEKVPRPVRLVATGTSGHA